MIYESDPVHWVGLAFKPHNSLKIRAIRDGMKSFSNRRWAKTWEFQALLKARPAIGDIELGRAYMDALMPMVWTACER